MAEHLMTFWKSPNHDSDVATVMRFTSEAMEAENRMKDSLSWADKAVKLEPSPESYYRLAMTYYVMSKTPSNNEHQTKQMMKMVLSKTTAAIKAMNDPTTRDLSLHNKNKAVHQYLIYDLHALALYFDEKYADAVQYNSLALEACTSDVDRERILKNDQYYRVRTE